MRPRAWAVTALVLLSSADRAEVFPGTVILVADGDTVVVRRDDRRTVRVRLEGVDCPERGQPFARRARQLTAGLVLRRRVEVRGLEYDRHGRLVARVRVEGRDLSLELVRAGLAWHYARLSSDADLARAERAARVARLGLWSQAAPEPPWDHRAAHPRPETPHR
jgi:endonuclease YncB( thermonuclease family)